MQSNMAGHFSKVNHSSKSPSAFRLLKVGECGKNCRAVTQFPHSMIHEKRKNCLEMHRVIRI